MLCAILISVYAFLCIGVVESASSGDIGLSLSYIIGLSYEFQFCVRQSAEWENSMVSVERILEYTELQQEAPKRIPDGPSTDNWPTEGNIDFKGIGDTTI